MRKYSLLKTLTITFLIFIVLSWFIDGGSLYNGTYYEANASTALGLGHLFSLPIQMFGLYVDFGLIFVVIGGFYGILNNTGAYKKITDKITNCFKGKQTIFLILTTVLFLTFESIMGSPILAFTLVPFFATVLYNLGYSKYKIMMSTVGTIIVSTFASTLGFAGFTNYLLDIGKSSLMTVRIALFFITGVILIVGLLLTEKKQVNNLTDYNELNQKPTDVLEPTEEKKVSIIPLIIIVIFFGILSIIGTYNWSQCLGIEFFNDISTKILDKISFLNGFSPLGSWGTTELSTMLLIASALICLIYRIKIKDMIESFKLGAKPMLKVSFYATFSMILFAYCYMNVSGYNFIDTIRNNVYNSSSEYLALKTAISSPLNALMINQPLYFIESMTSLIKTLTTNTSTLAMAGLSLQMSYGVSMLFLPTSMMLMVGLTYFDIPYLKWLRYAYKYILILILILGIIILI